MAADWLRYANQGATRNQPISPELMEALSFLSDLGVTMEVFSGGQPAQGPNRVGSHRHDHGRSADVFFHKDGRRLDWANDADRPIFGDIVSRAKAAGVTGFGAGPDYMQPGSMHIGFGSPAVWGAGGKSANAPDWLRAAYDSAPAASMPAQAVASAAPAPVQTAASAARAPALSAPRTIGDRPVVAVAPSAGPRAPAMAFGDAVAPRPPVDFGTVMANYMQRKERQAEEEAAEQQRRALLLSGIGAMYG